MVDIVGSGPDVILGSDDKSGRSRFFSLPAEIQFQIIRDLSQKDKNNLRLANRELCTLSSSAQESLFIPSNATYDAIEEILDTFPMVKNITWKNSYLNYDDINQSLRYIAVILGTRLKSLNFSYVDRLCLIENETINFIIENCLNLENLYLRDIIARHTKLTQLKECLPLQNLFLCGVTNFGRSIKYMLHTMFSSAKESLMMKHEIPKIDEVFASYVQNVKDDNFMKGIGYRPSFYIVEESHLMKVKVTTDMSEGIAKSNIRDLMESGSYEGVYLNIYSTNDHIANTLLCECVNLLNQNIKLLIFKSYNKFVHIEDSVIEHILACCINLNSILLTNVIISNEALAKLEKFSSSDKRHNVLLDGVDRVNKTKLILMESGFSTRELVEKQSCTVQFFKGLIAPSTALKNACVEQGLVNNLDVQ